MIGGSSVQSECLEDLVWTAVWGIPLTKSTDIAGGLFELRGQSLGSVSPENLGSVFEQLS